MSDDAKKDAAKAAEERRKRVALDHAQRASRMRDARAWSAARAERERAELDARQRRAVEESHAAELAEVEAARLEVARAVADIEDEKRRELEHGEPHVVRSMLPEAVERDVADAAAERARGKR